MMHTTRMRALHLLGLSLALVAVAACGPSNQKISAARSAAYNTEYALVWNALSSAVKRDYPTLKIEDAAEGVIVTDWKPMERVADGQDWQQSAGTNDGRYFFQLRAKIIGKTPPFRIAIDGQAARYRPGLSQLQPFDHHDADEPQWVPGRIDRVYVAVFETLEQYAVKAEAAPAGQAPEATPLPDSADRPQNEETSPALPGNDPIPPSTP
jgi:hypothetical protein